MEFFENAIFLCSVDGENGTFRKLWRHGERLTFDPIPYGHSSNMADVLLFSLLSSLIACPRMLKLGILRFSVEKNDSKTISVDGDFFKNGNKSCVFKFIRTSVDMAWIEWMNFTFI